MSHARRVLAVLLMLAVALLPVQAKAAGGYYTNEGYYEYAAPGWWGGPDTSGRVNVFEVDFDSRVGVDLFGCSGIGLFDFMKTTFNLNNITQQLKDSMKTILAKTLITTAMSVPQIASIFDTLNAFGNARFDIFQASCNMNDIRKDAMEMYKERCMADGMSAVECEEKYTSQSKNLLAKVSEEMSAQIKESENANEVMRSMFCEDQDGKYNPKSQTCGIMNFLPQFQICIDSSVGGGCKGTYGKTNPAMAFAGIINAGMIAAGGVFKTMDGMTAQLDQTLFPMSSRKAAADCAANKLRNDWQPEDDTTAPTVSSNTRGKLIMAKFSQTSFAGDADADAEKPDNTVKKFKEFMAGYCREEDPLRPLQAIASCLNTTGATGITVDKSQMVNVADYINTGSGGMVADQLALDAKGSAAIVDYGIKCAINKIGATDPYIWLALQNSPPSEREAITMMMQVDAKHIFEQKFYDFMTMLVRDARAKAEGDELPEPALKRVAQAIKDGEAEVSDTTDKKKRIKEVQEKLKVVLDDMKDEFQQQKAQAQRTYDDTYKMRATRAEMLRKKDRWGDTRYIRSY